MKRMLLILLTILVPLVAGWAEQVELKSNFTYPVCKLSDYSPDSNQALVVIAVSTTKDWLTGNSRGPDNLFFIKTQPAVGQAFRPVVNKGGNSSLFLFDKAMVGESYKLYSFDWSTSNGKSTTQWIHPCSIMGKDQVVTITKPGIYFMGAFTAGESLSKDFGFDEAAALKAVLIDVKNLPGWKKLIEDRLKEINK